MKDNSLKTVLLMEASSRQVLPMARAFNDLGYEITTVCEHKSDLGYTTKFKNNSIVIEGIDSDFERANKIYNEIISNKKYDVVLPLSDFSAEIAAKNKMKWQKLGSYVAVNDIDTFMLAYDKLNTMRICMENDIPCPVTQIIEDVDELNYENIVFPVVIKPRSACGSIGFHVANCKKELQKLVHDNSYGPTLIQEYIPQNGRQYNAHFVLDENHIVKTAICTEKCRWFPLDGGASTLSRTIKNDYILSICEKLLKQIGWVGYCDIDLMEDPRDGSIRIIEINARISANVKICFASGINIALQICELSENKEVSEFISYNEDVRLRCLHTDLLWFIKSKNRIKANPSWFSLKHTVDQIFSIDDLIPFISFSLTSVLKYKREMKKRER